jgi:glutamate racemase
VSLGLFDSGLGGLTVLAHVRARLPQHDIVYFADQAHVPYGDKTPEALLSLLRDNLAALDAANVDAVAMACNSSCAAAAQLGWPVTRFPVLDLIEVASAAVADAGYTRVGVVATVATASSGANGRAIRSRAPHIAVAERGAPALVPLVESGELLTPRAFAEVAAVCAQLPDSCDAVVLGCTHYPLLAAAFHAALGPDVVLIDPAVAQADAAVSLVASASLAVGSGSTHYYTTGDPVAFRSAVVAITGELDPQVFAAAAAALR